MLASQPSISPRHKPTMPGQSTVLNHALNDYAGEYHCPSRKRGSHPSREPAPNPWFRSKSLSGSTSNASDILFAVPSNCAHLRLPRKSWSLRRLCWNGHRVLALRSAVKIFDTIPTREVGLKFRNLKCFLDLLIAADRAPEVRLYLHTHLLVPHGLVLAKRTVRGVVEKTSR
ncbi:hypothetical protein NUW54_g3748 [Trametes sanguinea]|uniref:Uncharacterized protein n=1 Tax=Trametes sanguinea TaxID=158606 RepID=A0ACC1Q207_9APHY|nr:hypothetical protein NUW54_g3748 [Trametes sanguinea]